MYVYIHTLVRCAGAMRRTYAMFSCSKPFSTHTAVHLNSDTIDNPIDAWCSVSICMSCAVYCL